MDLSIKGIAIATLVAGLAACAGGATPDAGNASSMTAGVKCAGANACKGQGACAGADHACAGKNGCKGQGWVKAASADECTSKGGKVM